MLTISNIRKEQHDEWIRLVVDIDFGDIETPFLEKTIYFAVKNENADMLTDETYDAFVLIPLYLAMYFQTDLHICGKISKQLYQNIKWYIQQILCDFSDELTKVNLIVDGFTSIKERGTLIGTGISCGVDSLSTIYDHFINEKDPEYRINSLFIFNCGTHGDYENPASHQLFEKRYELNKKAADELKLPVFQVSSNVHAFTHKIGEQKMGYFAICSCIFSLQKKIVKYYISSGDSYQESKAFAQNEHDFDLFGFAESYLVPLLQTEHMQLIIDGCQYQRSQKTENIADWEIAQMHLNVCVNTTDGTNCCICSKCMRTLVVLDVMGKLEKFGNVFDIAKYRKHAFRAKCDMVAGYRKNNFYTDNVDFARAYNYPMPSWFIAQSYKMLCCGGVLASAKYALRALIGEEKYLKLKHKIRG